MTPIRLLPAASGVVLAAMLVVVPAGPAQAATANIAISGPAAGTHLTSTSVAITGSANIDPGLLGNNAITDLNVAVTFEGAAFDSCDNAGCGAGAGHASTNFSFTSKALARNGPYGVTANVAANEYLLGTSLGPTVRTGSATTNFNVGIPPAAPRNVKAQVNTDNSVTVSWTANPEPDLIGYQIQRQDSASSAPHVVNSFLNPTSWTDTTTAATGGDFGYTVIAFRPGADGTATATTVMHTSSAVATAKVAAPIPVTTTVAPVAGSQNPTTTTTVAAPSVPAAAPDLSAFLAQATKAGAIPTPPTASPATSTSSAPQVVVPSGASSDSLPALSPPDTYAPTLPYAAPATSTASTAPPASGGGPRVALPGRPAASHQHRSLLFSIAGGLLLCVVGLVVRVANHRREHLPLEPVMGEDADGSPVDHPTRSAERSLRTNARTEALAAVVARRNERDFFDVADDPAPVGPVTAADADPVRVGSVVDERAPDAARPSWRIVSDPALGAQTPDLSIPATSAQTFATALGSASDPDPDPAPGSNAPPGSALVSASAAAPAAPASAPTPAPQHPELVDNDGRGGEGLAGLAELNWTAGASGLAGAGDPAGAGGPAEAGDPAGAGGPAEAGDAARGGGLSGAGGGGRAEARPAEAAGAEAGLAEASQKRPRRARPARPWRSGGAPTPAVGQPGDYFRFILGDKPPSDAEQVAEQVEVTAPAR
jgi:hypothetical protein